MTLIPLPAFTDNYLWMLHDGQKALVVDPGDAAPVLRALQSENVRLEAILVTHHHADHTGGVNFLRQSTHAKVFGPALEPIPPPLHALHGGETIEALGLHWQVLHVPGHTLGHLAYYAADAPGSPLLFCGDTLFSAGCGRLFEGTALQMQQSLRTLAALPDATRVCCAHEYTLSNLRFALEVDPNNPTLNRYHALCQAQRAQGLPTLPSTMGLEREINPFLRSETAEVMASVQNFDSTGYARHGCFATLRQWKNQYR